jgi:hypothetical protein
VLQSLRQCWRSLQILLQREAASVVADSMAAASAVADSVAAALAAADSGAPGSPAAVPWQSVAFAALA